MSELNQKHLSMKFDYKFDCKQIEFLDTLVYIDQQNKLQTTLFWKPSDRQSFVNAKLKHPYSLQPSTSSSKNMLNIPKNTTVTLENLLSNLLVKDTKKMLPYSRFRRLPNSIENNCSISKNVMINNASLYQ